MPLTYIFRRTLRFQRKLAPALHFKRTHGAGWKTEGVCAPVGREVSVLPWLLDFILKSEKKPLCQSLQLMLLRLSSGEILTTKDERKEKILHDEEPNVKWFRVIGSVWDFFPFWSEEFLILYNWNLQELLLKFQHGSSWKYTITWRGFHTGHTCYW